MRWRSGLGRKGAAKTFDSFEVSKGKELAFQEARSWDPEDGDTGLLFYGPPSTGKTHLGCAIANKLIDLGVYTRFLPTVEIPKHDSEEVERLTDPDEYPVLVLDDVGAEKHTGRALECLYEIVDGRLRKGAQMVVTTNYQPSELKKKLNAAENGYGDRIVGRLREACLFVPVGGKDYRDEAI